MPAPATDSSAALHRAHLPRVNPLDNIAALDPMQFYPDQDAIRALAERNIASERARTAIHMMETLASGTVAEGLTYGDILLEPNSQSPAASRFDAQFDFSALLTKKLAVPNPLIPANMMTVFSEEMLSTLIAANPGTVLIADRFPKSLCGNHKDHLITELSSEWQAAICQRLALAPKNLIQSLGVDAFKRDPERYLAHVQIMAEMGIAGFCIDIAHGSNQHSLGLLRSIKQRIPEASVIIGNIATIREYLDCVEAGADAVKVGIGPGAMCSTRAMAGVGYPQLTALAKIWPVRLVHGVPIIADGGIQNPGDVSKALILADTVMIGGEFARAKESGAFTAAQLVTLSEKFPLDSRARLVIEQKIKECPDAAHFKLYAGQASEFFQLIYNGVLREGVTPEGEAHWRQCPRGIVDIYNEYLTAMASSLSYRGVYTPGEARPVSQIVRVSQAGHGENSVRKN